MKKTNTKPKTYTKMTSMTRSYAIIAIIVGVIMGACAILTQRVGSYLLSSLHDTNTTIGGAASTEAVATAQPKTSKSNDSGSSKGGKTTSKKSTTSTSAKHSSAPSSKTTKKSSTSPTSKTEIASESSCPGQGSLGDTAGVLVCMTNYARKYHRVSGIAADSHLMSSAAAKAQDIKSCEFSHTACGRTFNYWFAVKGYTGNCQAENIAQGQETPGEVFKAWMKSTPHRANILNGDYGDLGVAALSDHQGIIWVMHLGGC